MISLRNFPESSAIPSPTKLGGIDGPVDALTVTTQIGFVERSGGLLTVSGPFDGLTAGRDGELSILGRDVLGRFAVIVDRPGNVVCLLTDRHHYVIQET